MSFVQVHLKGRQAMVSSKWQFRHSRANVGPSEQSETVSLLDAARYPGSHMTVWDAPCEMYGPG
eukprot:2664701-Rhodomonas_salina.5